MFTQIGALPYKSIRPAIRYSLKHDIPFLPELPLRGEGILEYIKNPGQLSCLEEFKKNIFEVVKIQCVGPATLITAGLSEKEALERIYHHIDSILDGLQAEKVILFLDEPALGQVGFDFEELWQPIFNSFKVIPGVHCCGNMDWDRLFRSRLIEIISFDASQFEITNYPGYRSRKRIAWGINTKQDIKDFQPGDLLTPPCGLGSKIHTVKDCQRKYRKLRRLSRTLKRKEEKDEFEHNDGAGFDGHSN